MANQRLLKKLQYSTNAWNKWMKKNVYTEIDLSGANFSGANLRGADLSEADLSEALLIGANLIDKVVRDRIIQVWQSANSY